MPERQERTQIAVIGGGPAGLATGLAFARRGFAVTVVDCAIPPVDKACGEGVMPEGLESLRELGVVVPPGSGLSFRGIQFIDRRSSVAADFPGRSGLAVRRTNLHSLLAAQAEVAGVKLRWQARGVALAPGGVAVAGHKLCADFVVIADGANSQMRRQAGLDRVKYERRRYGFRRHFHVKPWSSYVLVFWGERSQIYIAFVSDDTVGVACLTRNPATGIEETLLEFPELRARLAEARPASSHRGALSGTRVLHRVQQPGMALVGDASGSVDAITGDGLSLAFREALTLADCYAEGRMDDYGKHHAEINRRARQMTSLLLLLERFPAFRKRTLAGFASRPEIFAALLAAHIGQASLPKVFASHAFDFCLSLV